MKQLLIILLTLLSFQASGQIYVDSPNDIRFVRYRDSLKNYLEEVRQEMYMRREIRKIKNKEQLNAFIEKHGFTGGEPSPQEKKGYAVKNGSRTVHYSPSVIIGYVKIYKKVYCIWNSYRCIQPLVKVHVRENKYSNENTTRVFISKEPGLTVINRIETAYGKTITIDSIKVR